MVVQRAEARAEAPRRLGGVGRDAERAGERASALDVVGVAMAHQQRAHIVQLEIERMQAALQLARREAGVDQHGGAAALHHQGVALAAAAEHREAHAPL